MSIMPLRTKTAPPEAKRVLKRLQSQYAAVPVSFAFMAHQPAVLDTVSNLLRTVMSDDCITIQHRELAYLKTAMLVDCQLCTSNHTASAMRAGYSDAQISALTEDTSSTLFDDTENTILRYVTQVTRDPGLGSGQLLDELTEQLGEIGAVDDCGLCGLPVFEKHRAEPQSRRQVPGRRLHVDQRGVTGLGVVERGDCVFVSALCGRDLARKMEARDLE